MKWPLRVLVVLVVAALLSPSVAQEPVRMQRPQRHLWFLGLGPVYWPDVRELDPSGSPFSDELGLFHAWGYAFELAYQRRSGRRGAVDFLAGIDVGFFGVENSKQLDVQLLPFGQRVDGDLVAEGLHLTPSFRAVVGGDGRWRYLIGGGVGFYRVEFVEILDGFFEAGDVFSEDTVGGYVSVGADYRLWPMKPRWRLRFEGKLHYADFGSTDRYAPGAGDLTGPIDTLVVGFVLAH